ncbi:hypothetical protein T492DRAFT_844557 [Pavlovales sp. CCMP2436]|nr:hypothetical protein T492DRAFT_844557 [Pavlovales sp. CCMP2436]
MCEFVELPSGGSSDATALPQVPPSSRTAYSQTIARRATAHQQASLLAHEEEERARNGGHLRERGGGEGGRREEDGRWGLGERRRGGGGGRKEEGGRGGVGEKVGEEEGRGSRREGVREGGRRGGIKEGAAATLAELKSGASAMANARLDKAKRTNNVHTSEPEARGKAEAVGKWGQGRED